jgi:phosphoglycerol transferase
MNRYPIVGVVALAGVLGVAGCGDKPESKAQIVVESAAPPAAPAPADPLGPRYEATLAEGIDFKKPGYPNFLMEVSGMSVNEPWGRWGVGPRTIFFFKEKLPERFKLTLIADTLWPNKNEPILVKVGNVVQEFKVGKPSQTYTLDFENHGGQKTIEFVVPKPVVPKEAGINSDTRPLSVAFVSLKIEH